MGLMNKLNKMKSFLFDEEDEEKEVKKPLKKKEKIETKKEKKKNTEVFETETKNSIERLDFDDMVDDTIKVPSEVNSRAEKTERKFSFPEFDDEDFEVASKKPEPIIPVKKKEEPKRVLYQGSRRKEETKKFKPSPIISPIYGLLDNQGNSIKEEDKTDSLSKNEEVTIDEVRKKAYGSLDDELEDTMKRLSTKTIEEAEKEMEDKELSRQKKKREKVKEEKLVVATLDNDNDNDDDDDDMILPNVNFKEIDVDKETNKKQNKKKEMSKNSDDDDDDDTKEQDLFNLIDTMYQNKEDEE